MHEYMYVCAHAHANTRTRTHLMVVLQGDARKLVAEDIPALRPTVMAGVPRVYSRIYDKVTAMVESKGIVTRTVFNMGFSATERAMRAGRRSTFWDAVLFRKLQKVLGGNVKIFLSGAHRPPPTHTHAHTLHVCMHAGAGANVKIMLAGAAPLSADLHKFLKVAFNAPVVQGYGMTENAGAACTMSPMSPTVGTVGAPICATEFKLVDVPEMEYLHTDTYPANKEAFETQVTFKGDFTPQVCPVYGFGSGCLSVCLSACVCLCYGPMRTGTET